MSEDIKVRIATPADIHQVMELGIAANEEIGVAKANPAKLLEDVWPALHRDGGIVGVIGKPGQVIEGGVLLRISNLWYSDELFLEERVVYVRPEFRKTTSHKGGRGRILCEFSKSVADSMGIPLVIGIATALGLKGKTRSYERVFGPPAGAFFLYGRNHFSDGFNPSGIAAE